MQKQNVNPFFALFFKMSCGALRARLRNPQKNKIESNLVSGAPAILSPPAFILIQGANRFLTVKKPCFFLLSRADAVIFKDYSELSMNLAFVIYRYFPHGGLQQDLEKIVCECIARGHKVTVCAGEWQGAEIPFADIDIISPRGLGRCE